MFKVSIYKYESFQEDIGTTETFEAAISGITSWAKKNFYNNAEPIPYIRYWKETPLITKVDFGSYSLFGNIEELDEQKEKVIKKRIENREIEFNYDKEHDLLYVSLKNCPNHYVDQLEDKYFDLWRDNETDEIVGAHIWNISEWLRTILTTKETQNNTKEVTK